ncbi:hypothetical protein [Sphingosinithalassobacter sp. CS137]|uniref:hypothetical protein n=1 Tax=Sphingosinithalassobacter sp. CS137 TaxID=2762748 RepID=UPI00165E1243|nr:hypothetical protein [Sphingosinithalassobacter sp. CS137]
MRRTAAALFLLAGCSDGTAPGDRNAAAPTADLETAAIERGLVRDPAETEIAGLYARDGDRLCIVPDGYGYRVGAYVDYGDGIGCSGSGRVSRAGDTMRVELGEGCSFDAEFDGERIRFPGQVPGACGERCTQRASFAGFEATRLSESEAEAAALRDPRGRQLCASEG